MLFLIFIMLIILVLIYKCDPCQEHAIVHTNCGSQTSICSISNQILSGWCSTGQHFLWWQFPEISSPTQKGRSLKNSKSDPSGVSKYKVFSQTGNSWWQWDGCNQTKGTFCGKHEGFVGKQKLFYQTPQPCELLLSHSTQSSNS